MSDLQPKQAVGRLGLLSKVLSKAHQVLQSSSTLAQLVIKFALTGLKHSNNDVRMQSYNMLLEVYRALGASIKAQLTGLRQT